MATDNGFHATAGESEHEQPHDSRLSTQTRQELLDWRRGKVTELLSKGLNLTEIADVLKVSLSTISRDVATLREQAHERIKEHVQRTLPHEYEVALTGLDQITKEAWIIASKPGADDRTKLQALSLARDCNSAKIGLLTNAQILENAIDLARAGNSKLQSLQRRDDVSAETIDDAVAADATLDNQQ